jgi:hypothetical protein
MNIDIRDIDPDFESDLKDIMSNNNIATASKAVRFIVTNYKSLIYENESLKKKLLKEEEKNRKLTSFRSKAFEFMALFKEKNDGNSSSGH